MAERSILVRLRADIEDFRRGMEESSALAGRQADAMKKAGKASLVVGGVMAAGLVMSAKAAIEWESAWAGVTKTVDGSAEQMAVLEQELRGLATTLPSSTTEIAAVAEAAGQLGVKREDITSFTKTMIDLGQTTNLTADQAATSIARIANIMGTAGQDVDRLGSTLVALGNDGASTEAEIVEMALRIAGAGKQLGLSEGEVLGFANALSSVGIEAEAGGSAISRVMIDIATAVETGSGDLGKLAEVAGVSSAEFTRAFGQDSAGAVNMFIDGLGRMTASGQSTFGVLDELGFSEIRTRDALLRLSNAQGLATASTALGNQAWKDNTALVAEADKRYETTASKIQVAKNSLNELAIDLGTVLLPAIGGAAAGFADLAGWLSSLPGPVQAALVIISALGAALALTGGAALIMVPKILALQATLISLGANAWTASIAMGALGAVLKTAGLVAAAVALAAGVYLVGRSLQTAAPEVAAMTEQLRGFVDGGKLGGEVGRQLGEDFSKLAGIIDVANKNKLSIIDGAGLNQVMTARDVLKNLDETLTGLVTGGKQQEAAALFDQMAQAVQAQGGSVDDLSGKLTGYYDALAAANRGQKDAAEGAYEAAGAIGALAVPLGTVYDSLGAYAEAMALGKDGTEALMKQVADWGSALADFVQPLGAYTDLVASKTEAEKADAEKSAQAQNDSVDAKGKAIKREYDIRLDAMKSNKGVSDEAVRNVEDQRDRELGALDGQKKGWEQYAGAVKVSVGEYLAELERQVKAQEKHADNMTMLAGRVSQGTLDQLARMGPEGAPLVAALVTASDAELSKMDDLYRRRTSEATQGMAGELYLANVLLPKIASKVGEDTAIALAVALSNGTTTVAQIARDYAGALAGGINPILTSLGKMRIAGQGGSRGGVTEYADGGVEDHRAQIAPAGAMRLWAEPETGGEAYIPLAAQKRPRSVDIWRETGRRLGVDFEEFGAGGFTVPSPRSTAPFRPPISTAGDGTMQVGYQAALDFMREREAAAALAVSGPAGGSGVAGRGNVDSELLRRFDAWNTSQGGRLRINSGFRSSEKQAMLYARYLAGNGPVAARPGSSNHEKSPARAIDYGPANWGLTGTARAFGLKAPVRSEAWHLEVMARGGILNPHVRDRGGPLLPGLTLNGTGRPEMVVPMAQGGVVYGGGSVSGQAAALAGAGGTTADIQSLLKSWDEHLDQLAEQKRREDLVLDVHREHAVVLATIGRDQEAWSRAVQATADAQQKVADFDQAARVDAEKDAVNRLVASIEAEKAAREAAADAAKSQADMVKTRLADLDTLLGQQDSINQRIADSITGRAKQRTDSLMEQAGQYQRLTTDQQQARADLDARQADIAQKYADDRRQANDSLLASETAAHTRLLAAGAAFGADQSRILGARSAQLTAWARLDERTTMSWGYNLEELLGNARQQAEDFAAWAEALGSARSRGVSEGVISMLGLDQGPQALNQLRQFSTATGAEIDDLNAAVSARGVAASRQAAVEQAGNYGQVGRDLTQAHESYSAELARIDADLIVAQSETNARLTALQTGYLTASQESQAQYYARRTELDATFMAGVRARQDADREAQVAYLSEQRDLRSQFAQIGTEQGRSQGDALAQGLFSSLPAVRDAARLLRQAMWVPASMVGGVFTDTTTGRAAYYGPAGEPAGSDRTDYLSASYRMPDGRTAWYHPGAAPRTASFDSGGWLHPGLTMAYNGTGVPERVMTASQMSSTQSRTVNFMPNSTVVVQDQADMNLLLSRAEFVVQTGAL